MLVQTESSVFAKAFDANSTGGMSGNFPALIPTITQPTRASGTNPGLLSLGSLQGPVANQVLLIPYGDGSDDQTFNLRLTGWKSVTVAGLTHPTLWIPVDICELVCTLGTTTGVASSPCVVADKFCDTITLTTGNANIDAVLTSPGSNLIGCVLVDTKGFNLLEVTIGTGMSATSGNALVSQM